MLSCVRVFCGAWVWYVHRVDTFGFYLYGIINFELTKAAPGVCSSCGIFFFVYLATNKQEASYHTSRVFCAHDERHRGEGRRDTGWCALLSSAFVDWFGGGRSPVNVSFSTPSRTAEVDVPGSDGDDGCWWWRGLR